GEESWSRLAWPASRALLRTSAGRLPARTELPGRHLQPEQLRQALAAKNFIRERAALGQRNAAAGLGDQILLVDPAQLEEEFGLLVEPGADAVEYRRNVLAHRGPVGATAREPDLGRRGEQPGLLPTDALHNACGEAPPEQLDQGVDRARAVRANRGPARLRHGRDLDGHPVDLRAADQRPHVAGRDPEVEHRAVPDVGAAARQPVREVAVALQVIAPGLAPKRSRNRAALDHHGGHRLPLLPE